LHHMEIRKMTIRITMLLSDCSPLRVGFDFARLIRMKPLPDIWSAILD
jgi:hypothetical protein